MQTKYCPECSGENMLTAKFCMSCRFQFPNLPIVPNAPVSSSTPVPVTPQKKVVVPAVIEAQFEEEGEEIQEEDVGPIAKPNKRQFSNYFIDYMDSEGWIKDVDQGVRIDDVIGSDKGAKKVKRKPDGKIPKTGKEILKSTVNRRNTE